jgi:hypothetical protein
MYLSPSIDWFTNEYTQRPSDIRIENLISPGLRDPAGMPNLGDR